MANEKRLIDANALVDSIEKRYCKPCEEKHEDYNHIRCRACWVDDMVGEIEYAQQTVDAVEVVHGHLDLYFDGKELQCSVCKATFWDEEQNGGTNYCPNCGAKMDGDGNG